MQDQSTHNVSGAGIPFFERLEDRLLLTTISGGEYFLYQNAQGDTVRVDLIGNPTDSAELISINPETGDVIDTPGLLFDSAQNLKEIVHWFDAEPILKDSSGEWAWAEYKAATGGNPAERGANTEIYAIYVDSASSATHLRVSTLAADPFTGGDWVGDLSGWNTKAANISPAGGDVPVLYQQGATTTEAAEGSGGVIIGSLRHQLTAAPAGNHSAVTNTAHNLSALGVFGGGDLAGGVTVADDALGDPQDLGALWIGGTLAGVFETGGSVGTVDLGMLYGVVDIDRNCDAVVLRKGSMRGSGTDIVGGGGTIQNTITDVRVAVGGSLGFLDSRGDLDAAIEVDDNPQVPNPSNDVQELEGLLWGNYSNDTMATAQLVGTASSTQRIRGSGADDWYGISLMAGQTVTVSGWIAGGDPLTWTNLAVAFYDADGNQLESLGYETDGEMGIMYGGGAQTSIVFTAPEAGIYYLNTEAKNPLVGADYDYTIELTGATTSNLGGVSVNGNYLNHFFGTGQAHDSNIAVKGTSNLAAVYVSGNFSGHARALGGSMVAFRAGSVADYSVISAERNVGGVSVFDGDLKGDVYAGGHSSADVAAADYQDAYVQNVSVSGDMFNLILAAGRVGNVVVTGSWLHDYGGVRSNVDGRGLSGLIDLIYVGGNWGGMGDNGGVPALAHGVGGNFGHVHVGGTIYYQGAGWIGPVTPVTYTDGRTVVLNDDGGGTLTIRPMMNYTITQDDDGNDVLTPTQVSTVSFTYIPVDDTIGGVGGVIANLTLGGSAELTVAGDVHLPKLNVTGENAEVLIKGTGKGRVYYVNATQDIKSFVNTTTGDLVSGSFKGVETMTIKGTIGPESGSVNQWLPGVMTAPTAANTATEVQYGWFRNKINGLNIDGDLGELKVGGALGDLRVTGAIGTVTVNYDGVNLPGAWEGVGGVVWSSDGIEAVHVGDGLVDDGGEDLARAGIFSAGRIEGVYIKGPFATHDGRNFGQISGAVLGRSIGEVVGTGGARLSGTVAGAELDWFKMSKVTEYQDTGGVDLVSFTGAGGGISNAMVAGTWITRVYTDVLSNGIQHAYFKGSVPQENMPVIGEIIGGGVGLLDVTVNVQGGSIGKVRAEGASADARAIDLYSADGMTELYAGRDIFDAEFHMPGKVDKIQAGRDIRGTFANFAASEARVGAIGTITAGRNVQRVSYVVAGEITNMTVGGSFIDSQLILQGPAVAYLKKLQVAGNIGGTITSGGHIGSIVSTGGAISADIRVLENDWDDSVAMIKSAGAFTGTLDLGGDLGTLYIGGAAGDNPALFGGLTQTLSVTGNLNSLTVNGNQYADLLIGGNLVGGTITGTVFGRVVTNGNLAGLSVGGDIGGDLGAGLGVRGVVTVYGDLKGLTLNNGQDLVSDLIVFGNIDSLKLNGGSVLGDVTSVNGAIKLLDVRGGGNIVGDISADTIVKVALHNGDLLGDVTAGIGGIDYLLVSGGDIDADVTSTGLIDELIVTGGSILAGRDVEAALGINSLKVTGGNVAADVTSNLGIGLLSVSGGNLTGNVSAGTRLAQLTVSGAVDGAGIRATNSIGRVTAGSLDNAVLSAFGDIEYVIVDGDVVDTLVLAGHDVGANYVLGDGDDTPLPGGDLPHSGSIREFSVGGDFDGSIVAAGISPGADGDLLTTGDNIEAGGISRIDSVTVGGNFLNQAASAFLAESHIDPAFLAVVPVGVLTDVPPAPALAVGDDFGESVGQASREFAGGLTLGLTGPGVGTYDVNTGNLVINGATTDSRLTLTYTGVGQYGTVINITGADNVELKSLSAGAGIVLGDVTFDGNIATLTVDDISVGATWALAGSIGTFTVGGDASFDMDAMSIGTFTVNGDLAAGRTFNIGYLGSVTINGNNGTSINVVSGGLASYRVTGNHAGSMTVRGTLGSVNVTGALGSGITVTHGNLTSLRAASAVGDVAVQRGSLGSYIVTGAQSGSVDVALGVTTFQVGSVADFSAMTVGGNVNTLTVTGLTEGTFRIGGSITTARFGGMQSAVVTARGNITTTVITGNMTASRLSAGYDLAGGVNGSIGSVRITGDMITSSITAAVYDGADNFFGTGDDTISGAGTIGTVTVTGNIVGDGVSWHSYGIFAANNLPTVTYRNGQTFSSTGNAYVMSLSGPASALKVLGTPINTNNSLTIFFNHSFDMTTISDASFGLLASVDGSYLTAGDNTDVVATIPHSYSFDGENHAVTFHLSGGTWESLGVGGHFFLTLDGNAIADSRGNGLDGNGDGIAGDNYFAHFQLDAEGNFALIPNNPPDPFLMAQDMPHTQDTLVLNLDAVDDDGETITYTAVAEVSGAGGAFALKEQLGLTQYMPGWDNWAGQGEKWLKGAAGWYYIKPDGTVVQYSGGAVVGTLDVACHTDPVANILNAAPAAGPAIDVTVVGNQITIDPPDGFVGEFTVYVTASDGRDMVRKQFDVTVTNHAPELDLADRTMPHTQNTLVITAPDLPAVDADGETIVYTAEVVTTSAAATLRDQLGLTQYMPSWDNWAGRGEKWLKGTAGWYTIETDGTVKQYAGGAVVGTLDAACWADPVANILNAAAGVNPGITVDVVGNTLTIDPPAGYAGTFTVNVTAADGATTVEDSFDVTVTNTAPDVDVADQTMPYNQDTLVLDAADGLAAVDADGDAITYTAEVAVTSAAATLRDQLGLTQYMPSWDNWAGRGEKWLKGTAGWYTIETDGAVKQYAGGAVVGNLDVACYNDPVANILNAAAGVNPGITVNVVGNQITIDPPADYLGTFTVNITADDGVVTVEDSFTVTVENQAPVVNVADQTMPHTQDTLVLDAADGLAAVDADGDVITYTAEVLTTSAAATLRDQLGLTQYVPSWDNWAGRGEKWLKGTAGWYTIETDGAVKQYAGGAVVGNLDVACHDDPVANILNAAAGVNPGITADVVGNQITVDPPADYIGTFQVKVTATDGVNTVVTTFDVTVTNQAPVIAVADQNLVQPQDTLTVNMPAVDADGDAVTYTAEAVTTSAAYELKTQLGLTQYKANYDNWLGQNDKWLRGAAGWYYILPDGTVKSYTTGAVVGNLDANAWADPVADILNAPQGVAANIVVTVNGNEIVVDPPADFTGEFDVNVTATDGFETVEGSFLVTVT